jgi:hypothetical protein
LIFGTAIGVNPGTPPKIPIKKLEKNIIIATAKHTVPIKKYAPLSFNTGKERHTPINRQTTPDKGIINQKDIPKVVVITAEK